MTKESDKFFAAFIPGAAVGFIICLIGVLLIFGDKLVIDQYQQGQIDAIEGRIKYQPTTQRYYIPIKEKE